ncbi:MAG: DEAD/DEAH box helicase [Chitinophagales bacterium]|nr:DEAD/DEAH box helicase [Chitinophagales bacterium]
MHTFSDLGLSQPLLEAIEALGFSEPTPIQEKTIPVLLQNTRDLIALAQTGTGKTAAFGLPLIQLVDTTSQHTQALILSPTRELCMQITSDLKSYSRNIPSLKVVAVYGGAGIQEQIFAIRKGAQIVVATPGRLIDLIGRNAVDLKKINYIILDESDEMLNMGFQEDLDEILKSTPKEKHTWLFSATMPGEIRRISKKYMSNPAEVTVGEANLANENIEHQYFVVHEKEKYLALKRIVDFTPDIFGIIFCRTKIETQKIAEDLIKDGYDADSLHGDLKQSQRDKVMRSFKNRSLQLLVATDVAARGIDVDNVTHIIHLHLPDDMDFYTHRSGRTARAGKSGISMVLVSNSEVGKIKQLERKLQTTFAKQKIPAGIEVCEKQLLALIHKVHEIKISEKEIAPFVPAMMEEFADLSKEDVIKRFASIEFNRFADYYRGARDLNIPERREYAQGNVPASFQNGKQRLFVNLGKMDELNEDQLVTMVKNYSHLKPKEIMDVKLKGAYSFFCVESNHVDSVLHGFKGAAYRGRRVRVEVQNEDEQRPKRTFQKKEFSGERKSFRTEGKYHSGKKRY